MAIDRVFSGFLINSLAGARRFEAQCGGRLKITAEPGELPRRFAVELRCRGLIRNSAGSIVEHDRFCVGIFFYRDYLRGAPNPFRLFTLLSPMEIFHPNAKSPFLCSGALPQGADLVTCILQIHRIISFQIWSSADGLNEEACIWARKNQHRFPIDPRPLRAGARFDIEEIKQGATA